MGQGERIQEWLHQEHLGYEWLGTQLRNRGVNVGKAAISLALTERRSNDTSVLIILESLRIMKDYDRTFHTNYYGLDRERKK